MVSLVLNYDVPTRQVRSGTKDNGHKSCLMDKKELMRLISHEMTKR